ncbi:hypothetical protein [Abyssisolibacter fermentans]|uniref:hypothetical protein n=1 Tax=Abyssisolibacter fermentans TaxID=1766203 RepID=UPI0012E3E840|nr:hypothetical protein [Abyssisolibacter fermentans]
MKLDFNKNVGITDKIVRTLIAILLVKLVYNKKLSNKFKTVSIAFSMLKFVEASYSY